MAAISVYDKNGDVLNQINISDTIEYESGRVSRSDKGYYFKGIGVPYRQHLSRDANARNIIGKSQVFYCGYAVKFPQFVGKTGIFQERYQPYFLDFIGSCGPKEKKLVSQSQKFELSSVKVLDCVDYDTENQQSYYKVEYDCERKRYVDSGDPVKLLNLINYLVCSGWNFPWDKTSINDISADGRVSDVADMFQSHLKKHKLGTVYSILYSLLTVSPNKYIELLATAGIKHKHQMDNLFIPLHFLSINGINIDSMFGLAKDEYEVYRKLVTDFLLAGRNCAGVEDQAQGNKIMKQYIQRFNNMTQSGVV